jgi:hypothetical protein
MDELQRVLERQIRELASSVFGHPESRTLYRVAEADVGVRLGGQERMFPHSARLDTCNEKRKDALGDPWYAIDGLHR